MKPLFLVAVAPALLLDVAAKPAWAFEELPETQLVVEATIPFKPSKSILEAHDAFLTFGFGSLWMINHPNLVRIDPVDYHTREIALPGIVGPIKYMQIGDDAVWIVDTGSNTAYKVDPASEKLVLSFPCWSYSRDARIGVGAGSLWVVTGENAEQVLTRYDAKSGAVQAKIELPSKATGGALYDFGAVWVVGTGGAELYRVDPASNKIVSRTPIHRVASFIISAEGSIWVNSRDGWLDRIDPATSKVVATMETGYIGVDQMTSGGGYVWLGTNLASVVEIDPKTNKILRAYVGGDLNTSPDILYAAGSLWTFQSQKAILRLKPPS